MPYMTAGQNCPFQDKPCHAWCGYMVGGICTVLYPGEPRTPIAMCDPHEWYLEQARAIANE